jgi:MFS family permease
MSNKAHVADVHETKRRERRFKWVIGTPYFVQGLSGEFINNSALFFIKYALAMGEAGGQLFQSLTTLGWMIKPLWGFISDRFPIFGYKRKSWYILMAGLATGLWITNAVLAASGMRIPIVFLVGFILAFSTSAFIDVVADALMVEHGRRHKKVGSNVNFQWTALAVASAPMAFLGGWLADKVDDGEFSYWMVFLIVGIFPLITLIVGIRNIEEERVARKEKVPLVKGRQLAADVRFLLKKVIQFPKNTFIFFRNNHILWYLVLFIFFWRFSPSVGYIEKSYLLDVREFSGTVFGIITGVGGIIFLLSILTYRFVVRRFTHVEWYHYLFAMVGIGVCAFPFSFLYYLDASHPWWDYLLMFSLPDAWNPLPEWNRYMWMMLLATMILGFATIPAFMIPLTLAGETVKLTHAGLSYAFLMAFINTTNTLEGMVGAGLYSWFESDSMQWLINGFAGSPFNIAGTIDGRTLILQIFVYIGLIFTFLSIPFILLLKRQLNRADIHINLGTQTTE